MVAHALRASSWGLSACCPPSISIRRQRESTAMSKMNGPHRRLPPGDTPAVRNGSGTRQIFRSASVASRRGALALLCPRIDVGARHRQIVWL
jgi:hypothetical protein